MKKKFNTIKVVTIKRKKKSRHKKKLIITKKIKSQNRGKIDKELDKSNFVIEIIVLKVKLMNMSSIKINKVT